MITQIEVANHYFLKPIDALDENYDPHSEWTPEQLKLNPDLLHDNAIPVGSKYVLNEVAVYMTDDDVMATAGVAGERCVILTFLSRKRCKEIVKLGQKAFDKKWAGAKKT